MSTPVDRDALLELVRKQHDGAVKALGAMTDASQRGVLEAGEILGAIVAERQAVSSDLERRLSAIEGTHAPNIREAVEAQGSLVESYVSEVTPLWAQTLTLVAEALECASEINQCAARVAQVSKAMGVLQMCCKSEIAHLGEAAVSFQSTVHEMRALTRSTDDLNRRLERLSSELSSELPPIATLGSAERRRTRAFGKAMTQSLAQVDHASEALLSSVANTLDDTRSQEDQLRSASYRALSALQFQDPLVQDLQRVDSRLGEAVDILEGKVPDDTSFIAYKANIGDVVQGAGAADVANRAEDAEPEEEDENLDSGDFLLF